MKFLSCFILLLSHYWGVAQDLSGTWEGVFYSDRLGKRSEFFIRIYLEQEDDFVWGVCEAMSVEKSRVRDITDFFEDELRCRYPVSGTVPAILERNSQVSFSTRNTATLFMAPRFCETFSSFLLYYNVEDSIAELSGEWVAPMGENVRATIGANKVLIKRLSGKTPGFIEEFHPGREKRIRLTGNEEKDKKADGKREKDRKNKFTLFKKKPDGENADVAAKDSSSEKKNVEEPINGPRIQDVQQSLQLDTASVQILLYDNGVVDGDVVSLFLNDIKIAENIKLSEKPFQFQLQLERGKENQLRLYAENVGQIPPNTAVLIIKAGKKRYDINLSASLQRDAVVILNVSN